MADTLQPGAVTPLLTSFAVLYTVPAATKAVVALLRLVNTSGAAVTVRLCVVPSAGSPAVGNALLWDFSVAANDFIDMGRGLSLPAEASVRALASADSVVNLKLDVVESA